MGNFLENAFFHRTMAFTPHSGRDWNLENISMYPATLTESPGVAQIAPYYLNLERESINLELNLFENEKMQKQT